MEPTRASLKEKDTIMGINFLGRLSRIAAAAILVAAGATVVSLLAQRRQQTPPTSMSSSRSDSLTTTRPSSPSEEWRSEPTSNRPESTRYPTAKIAAAATASCRPVPRTRALQQRRTTMTSLQARPTPFSLPPKALRRANCRINRAHTSSFRAARIRCNSSHHQASLRPPSRDRRSRGIWSQAVSWPTSPTAAG